MIRRNSCYFCTSAFQLFPIIALASERRSSSDLYIDPQFDGAAYFANRIRECGIFDNVEVIKSQSIYQKYMSTGPGLINHLQIGNTYLHVSDIAKSILLDGVEYDNLFLSSKAYLPRMVFLYFIKMKKKFSTYYFDDGAGTYENNRAYQIKRNDRILRKMLFGDKAIETGFDRYVFSPLLFKQMNTDAVARPINRVWENESGRTLMNEIFDLSCTPNIKEKMIILDQPKEELFNNDDIKKIDSIYSRFVKTIGFDEAIVKKHPRSSAEDFKEIRYIEGTGIPFELYCLNIDMNKKILISHSSTAVATPKILFDQEPTVIVLTKLIDPITGEKDLFEEFFCAVKNTYRNKEKFIIPSSMDELDEICSILQA